MSVKISELPILDSLADNDVIAGVDTSANVTSKIEMATLKNYIDTNTQYTAGTNINITDNVISAPFVYDKTQTNALLDDFKDETNASIEDLKDETDTQIKELQSEVDSLSMIYNAFPTESGEGESVTLDDTAEVKFKKFDLKGNTSQTTYSGYNIMNFNVTQSSSKVTVNNDGTITINGTGGFGINYEQITLEANKTYKQGIEVVSGSLTSGNIDQAFMSFNAAGSVWLTTSGKVSYTPTENISKVAVWVNEKVNCNNLKIRIWGYEGTDDKNFEPYVGKSASPNPSYPQPVNVVSGDNEINVVGKNLWTISKTQIGSNWHNTYVEDGETISVTATGTYAYRSYYIEDLIVGQQYTVSFDGIKDTNATYGRVTIGKSTGTTDEYGFQNMTTTKANYHTTFTATSNVMHITIYPVLGSYSSGGTITISNIQLEKGSSATSYEAFNGNTYNIDLPVENLWNENTQVFTNQSRFDNPTKDSNNKWTFTASSSGYAYAQSSISLPAGTYTFSSVCTGGDTLLQKDGSTITNPFTITETSTITFRVYKSGASQGDVVTLEKVMLCKGSKANSYTPYGTTPIELCKIGNYQDYFYKGKGYNLLNISGINATRQGILFKEQNDFISITGTSTSGYTSYDIEVNTIPSGETVYLYSPDSTGNIVFYARKSDSGNLGQITNGGSLLLTSDMKYLRINVTDTNAHNDKFRIMLSTKSTTTYEPYNAKGKWYKYGAVGEYILKGIESWELQSINSYGIANFHKVYNLDYIGGVNNLSYTNYFSSQETGIASTQNVGYLLNNSKALFIRFDSNVASTVEDFKAWLSTHNVKIKFVLPTPTTTEITYQPLIDQLNELEKAISYDLQTNISQVSNDKPFILDVTAIKSLQNVLDRIELLES